MELLIWILFGGIVGWIASLLMNTNAQQDMFLNIIVGGIGAFIGSWIMRYFGQGDITGFNFYSFFVAIIGACIFIGIVKIVR